MSNRRGFTPLEMSRIQKAQGFRAALLMGFTLIELLVVIAIIALLMAILMPTLARVKKQAQSIVCQARLKEWGLIFKFYTDDYDGYFNEGWGYGDHHPGRSGELGLWMNALRPYYKDNWDMLLCPTAIREMENNADWGTFKAAVRTIATPEGSSRRYVFSYSINSWTNYMIEDRGSRPVEWFWKNTQNVKGANQIPVFGDATWHDAWPRHTDEPAPQRDAFGIGNQGTSGEMNHFCIDRHNGFINMLFIDWSIRHVGLKENWTLKWHRAFDTMGPYTRAGGILPSNWPIWLRSYKDY